jgi:hypothetical protein
VFRDDPEQDAGMKVNTGSGMKPNSFQADPGTALSFAGIPTYGEEASGDLSKASSMGRPRWWSNREGGHCMKTSV